MINYVNNAISQICFRILLASPCLPPSVQSQRPATGGFKVGSPLWFLSEETPSSCSPMQTGSKECLRVCQMEHKLGLRIESLTVLFHVTNKNLDFI